MSVPYQPVAGPAHRDLRGHLRRQVLLHALLPGGRAGRGGVRGRPAALLAHHAVLRRRRGHGRPASALVPTRPREGTGFLDILHPAPEQLPAWLTEEDVDVYAEALRAERASSARSASTGTWTPTGSGARTSRPRVYTMPTGFLTGSLDPVALMMPERPRRWRRRCPTSAARPSSRAPGTGCNRRRPAETNAALLAFLDRLGVSGASSRCRPARRRALADGGVARGRAPARRRPGAAARRGLRRRRARSPTTYAVVVVHRGRVVAERYHGALEHFDRPPTPVTADTPLLSWSMAKSMLHAVGRAARRRRPAGPRRPGRRARVGRPRATRATPSRCAICWPCATGSTSSRTTSTTASPTSSQMLFGDGQADMAHFAADRPLAAPPGTRFNYSSGTSNIISGVVARTVGPGEPYARFLHGRLFGPLGMTSADPEFDEAGTWVGFVLPPRHRARLGPLRTALPARRHVGRRARPAGRLGGLRPHHGRRPTPRTPAPTVRTGGAWPATPARHVPRLGLRGPVDHHLPGPRPRRGAPGQDAARAGGRPRPVARRHGARRSPTPR